MLIQYNNRRKATKTYTLMAFSIGIEPITFFLTWKCSTNWAKKTIDVVFAYTTYCIHFLEPTMRFELTSNSLGESCFIPLSYIGIIGRGSRIRTHINGFGDRCPTIGRYPYNWSGWQDLNLRPLDPKSSVLPNWTTSRYMVRNIGLEPITSCL